MTRHDLPSAPCPVSRATAAGPAHRTYQLLDRDARTYASPTPGRFGGHRRSRIYGRLDCPAPRRAIAAGGYLTHRVFFADEETGVAAGYRPCPVCMTQEHRWCKHP